MKCNLIVVEGACDGIGKSTQYDLLYKYLKENKEVYKHHFPTYNSYQGRPVEEYLKGNFGELSSLSPYFINNLYALDRAITYQNELKKYYDKGATILLDRYTTSSIIYQSCIFDNLDKKCEFIDYVVDFEYNKLGIPEPNQVIFLTANFDLVTKMRNERKVNDGVVNDIHERDLQFMKKVYDNAIFVANYLNWDIINCENNNKLDSIENIHKKVLEKVKL